MNGLQSGGAAPSTLIDAIDGYETALVNNDAPVLSAFFAEDDGSAPSIRVDDSGALIGYESIRNFRMQRKNAPRRTLLRRFIRMLSEESASVVSIFERNDGGIISQTQVWKLDDRWKIVSAHLTYPRPAVDSRIWRVVGTPLKQGKTSEVAPLRRATVAVKDLYGVEGYAIGAGSEAFLSDGRPQLRNSWPVQKLLDAGADITGISRTDEFAYSLAGTNAHYGTPPNPQAPERISGGSSSGSASATAMGQVDIGLGSDTGGSVRVPSAYQHLWGIRTTHGSIPMEGVLPLAQSFDTVGWMTRDPELLQLVAKVLIPTCKQGSSNTFSGRVVWSEELVRAAHEDIQDAIHQWLNIRSQRAGSADEKITFVETALDNILGKRLSDEREDRLSDWLDTYKVIQGYEAWRNHGEWIDRHWETMGQDVASRFRTAKALTMREYSDACDRMNQWRCGIRETLGNDVLLLPSASSVAPRIVDARIGSAAVDEERTATMRLTCIAGLSGLPAVNIPIRTKNGLPCGICVVGPAGSDIDLIGLARKLQDMVHNDDNE